LTNTSPNEIAREVLERCIAGNPPAELPPALLEDPDGQALFGTLVEGLADRFEPALCDAYVNLFAQPIAALLDGLDAGALVDRYRQVRRVRPITAEPQHVFVLSRITLGADVAVTSVLLNAAQRRFPKSRISFVGPRKNFELMAGDHHVHNIPVDYRRGGLAQRLAVFSKLQELFAEPGCIVLDPDSRLTQLGLLPVCPPERYYFFESRAYGSETTEPLSALAASWARETMGVKAKPFIALNTQALPVSPITAYVTASFGVGENPAKRIPDPFEEQLISLLSQTGMQVFIDRGAGGEEAERVRRAAERSGESVRFWEGSFAGFAALMAGSRLYVGYDSAGQHAAAACGVPQITVFAGFPVPRMFDRWRTVGKNSRVVRIDPSDQTAEATLPLVRSALQELRPVVS